MPERIGRIHRICWGVSRRLIGSWSRDVFCRVGLKRSYRLWRFKSCVACRFNNGVRQGWIHYFHVRFFCFRRSIITGSGFWGKGHVAVYLKRKANCTIQVTLNSSQNAVLAYLFHPYTWHKNGKKVPCIKNYR